eukprot:6206249-Pleurochrysis_carterae.AAC.1
MSVAAGGSHVKKEQDACSMAVCEFIDDGQHDMGGGLCGGHASIFAGHVAQTALESAAPCLVHHGLISITRSEQSILLPVTIFAAAKHLVCSPLFAARRGGVRE